MHSFRGLPSTQTYDSVGRLSSTAGPNQLPVSYSYGGNGLVSLVRTTGLYDVTYTYDSRGNRTQVNSGGRVTAYAFDKANRLLTETNPLGKATSYTYDVAGNRVTKTDAAGEATRYEYDADRRLSKVTFADGSTYEYGYDSRGARTVEKGPSHERHLAFDELGRLAQVQDVTLGSTLEYGYDAASNRIALTEGALHYAYAFDLSGRLKKATDSAGHSVAFDYDLLGRRTRVVRPNGVASAYGYDSVSQLLQVQHAKGGQVLAGYTYEYDEHGMRVSKTAADGTVEGYTYDTADRLKEVRYGNSKRALYNYDGLGNRTGEYDYGPTGAATQVFGGSHNAFNQLTTRTQSTPTNVVTNYAYSPSGNLLSETTGASVKSYTWDLDNRLRQVTMPDGAAHSYEYDANGLRVKQVTPTGTTKYLLDGASVVEELDASGATTASYLQNPQVVDEVLSFATGGATYYPLTDALGSVVAVTDSAGTVVRTNSYEVYGARTTSGTGPQLAYGFTGREHDATGLNYHRDRYMDSVLGRWGQPDRAGFVDGPNVYAYVVGQPTVATDPSGLWRSLMGFEREYVRKAVIAIHCVPGFETVAVELASMMEAGLIMQDDLGEGRNAKFMPFGFGTGRILVDHFGHDLATTLVHEWVHMKEWRYASYAGSIFGPAGIVITGLAYALSDFDRDENALSTSVVDVQLNGAYATQNDFDQAARTQLGYLIEQRRKGGPCSDGRCESQLRYLTTGQQ